jgi:hypothetical protein
MKAAAVIITGLILIHALYRLALGMPQSEDWALIKTAAFFLAIGWTYPMHSNGNPKL